MSDKERTVGEPETFELRSMNLAAEKVAALRRLFPEAFTEGGKIDFDKLKLALGEDVDLGKERYGLVWPGKAECFKTIQAPSLGTLRACPEESIGWDTTENLIIEGDNLEVIKLLQKSYLGRVKMIYIDPPYNTGNEFIYPDNYTESLQTYLEYTGQLDAEGRTFSTNTETDGRFHSKWLSMMYPRLYLARNLLREDGTFFVSINDGEAHNLWKVCLEVFGEENFLASFAWQNLDTIKNDAKYFSDNHEYVLCFARNKEAVRLRGYKKTEKQAAVYKNRDNDPNGPYLLTPLHAKSGTEAGRYTITLSTGQEWSPPPGTYPRFSQATLKRLDAEGRLYLDPKRKGVPQRKTYLSEVGDRMPLWTFWRYEEFGSTRQSNAELKGLLGEGVFENPKPSSLIRAMVDATTSDEDIVLDFFAGSGPTAHAVLALNEEDGGNRRFVLVQLPEPTGREDYPTIAEITKERVRRVIARLNEEDEGALPLDAQSPQDRGFRVFKLDESNFTTWDARAPKDADTLAEQLEMHVDHVRDGRGDQDLLFELLLKSGFSLTTPVEVVSLAGNPVYSVLEGALVVCLAREMTQELIEQIAALDPKPERVICLDEGFAGNDQLKVNANETFRTKGILTFKTV